MKIIEKFSGVFLIAGLFMFLGAFISLGLVPALMVNSLYENQGLPKEVPPELRTIYPEYTQYTSAVLRGRDLYGREGCWHCHSQYVRPVSNENLMYGPVSTAGEYQSVLHLPQMFGTRRAGPDLSRESGKHSNDWHLAHLYKPVNVVPDSIMPGFPWYFETDAAGVPHPKPDAWALVAYLQVLGVNFADTPGPLEAGETLMPPKE
jgi:cbb3-type cytochrome c oxidase subunit II